MIFTEVSKNTGQAVSHVTNLCKLAGHVQFLAVAVVAVWAIFANLQIAAADSGAVQLLQPSLPDTPARDEAFLSDLVTAGLRVTDVHVAIAGGRDVCAFLAAGRSALEAVEQGQQNNPTMTREDERSYTRTGSLVGKCGQNVGTAPYRMD
jgi:hypothetical protein